MFNTILKNEFAFLLSRSNLSIKIQVCQDTLTVKILVFWVLITRNTK